MRLSVSDIGSNYEENLQRWARALGTGEVKRKIFETVYSSRKNRWTISEIADRTGLNPKLIVSKGREMCVKGLFEQIEGSRVVYQKIADVHLAKQQILRLAGNTQAREGLPTKRSRFKGGVVNVRKTTNRFENVGVANTGRMSGNITGNSQKIVLNESAKELMAAFEKFRAAVQRSSGLSIEQREDAIHAVNDLETEAGKPEENRSMSRIRNAVNALKMLASGTDAVHKIYEQVHPFIVSHFHLP